MHGIRGVRLQDDSADTQPNQDEGYLSSPGVGRGFQAARHEMSMLSMVNSIRYQATALMV